jgi:monoamine oxidase
MLCIDFRWADFMNPISNVILPKFSPTVKRRKALKTIGLAASAGLSLPFLSGLSSCSKDDIRPEIDYDGIVGVIGAGASGLFAADILKSKGVQVRIFEASNRIGGRVRSVHLSEDSPVRTDFPIELGAERIIGSNSFFAEVIRLINVPAVDLSTSQDHFILGSFLTDTEASTDPDFIAAKNFIDLLGSRAGAAGSVQAAITAAGINSRTHAILNAWIGNRYGTTNTQLGMGAVGESMSLLTRDQKEKILVSNPMQDVIASRFSAVVPDVELNTVVKVVDYSGEKIRLTGEVVTDSGTSDFLAEVDKLIIAVPISIMKNGGISFAPTLPSGKTTSLSKMGMDACVRVIMDFKQNFWSQTAGFVYGGTTAPEYLSSGFQRSDFNKTMSVTIYGPSAEALSVLGKDGAEAKILEELDVVFDGKATANIRKDNEGNNASEYFDWTLEPFIQGGVSYLKPGGTLADRTVLAESVNDFLFFAGEACDATGDAGTISGALRSGERAALELVDSIIGANP